MKNLIRGLFLGILFGIVIGLVLAEKQREHEEKAASESFANDPDVIAIRNEWRREHQAEEWIKELEEKENNE